MPRRTREDEHRLVLLRHAKSSWAEPGLDDRDRPLNGRGRAAGKLVAHWLAEHRPAPDLVLCSDALRTRQTLELIAPALMRSTRTLIEERLYLAAAPRLLDRLCEVEDGVRRVLLIGHNPGLHELAERLARHAAAPARRRLGAKFPTAAIAAFRFAGPWSGLDHAAIALTDFVTPADLDRAMVDD